MGINCINRAAYLFLEIDRMGILRPAEPCQPFFFMSKQGISTLSDLHADREKNQTEMNKLIDYRQHLRNKVRRALPAEKETLRAEKQDVTEKSVISSII